MSYEAGGAVATEDEVLVALEEQGAEERSEEDLEREAEVAAGIGPLALEGVTPHVHQETTRPIDVSRFQQPLGVMSLRRSHVMPPIFRG